VGATRAGSSPVLGTPIFRKDLWLTVSPSRFAQIGRARTPLGSVAKRRHFPRRSVAVGRTTGKTCATATDVPPQRPRPPPDTLFPVSTAANYPTREWVAVPTAAAAGGKGMRVAVAFLGVLLAAGAATASDPVPLWNEAALNAIRAERTPPPVATSGFGPLRPRKRARRNARRWSGRKPLC
jgi:hypothetical protein